MWTRAATRDPASADAVTEPVRQAARFRGARSGRSLGWWIAGVARKEGIVEIETLRRQVRECVDAGLWGRMIGALDAAVEKAVEQGMVLRLGSLLVSPRFKIAITKQANKCP